MDSTDRFLLGGVLGAALGYLLSQKSVQKALRDVRLPSARREPVIPSTSPLVPAEALVAETSVVEAPVVEAPRVPEWEPIPRPTPAYSPPVETPLVEAEAPVVEAPAVEIPEAETPSPEALEVETAVPEALEVEEPVVEAPPAEEPVAEAPEADVGTGRLRRAVSGVLRGAIARAETAVQTLVEAVDALVHRELGTALHRVADCWREDPATESLGDAPELTRIPDDLSRRVSDAVQQWYAGVHEGTRSRSGQPRDESGIDPAGAALTVLAVGADASWIGPVARAVIEGEGPLPDLPLRVHTAREDLRRRLADLVVSEYVRLRSMLDDTGLWDDRGPELRGAAGDVHDALTAYREIAEDD